MRIASLINYNINNITFAQNRRLQNRALPEFDEFTSSQKPYETTIKDNLTGKLVKAQVIKKKTNSGEALEIYADNSKKCTGYALYYKISGYYGEDSDKPSLFIKHMENLSEGRYGNVGRELHKSVVRESQKLGFEGRVALDAAWGSGLFHYKCGFRPVDKKGEEQLEIARKMAHDGKLSTETKQITMYLPKENVAALLAQ